MKLESIKLSELKPLKENVRKHSEKQINELVRSIKQFGQTRAMVIDEDNNILIGNALYYALVNMNKDNCQCFRKTDLSEIEKKKLILSDNKIYALGSDDFDGINNFVNLITKDGDFDIAGFDTYTLEMMTLNEKENEEDISKYGTITNEKLVQSEQPNSFLPSYSENDINQDNEILHTTNEEQVMKEEKKSVICSNCGEVIYLD